MCRGVCAHTHVSHTSGRAGKNWGLSGAEPSSLEYVITSCGESLTHLCGGLPNALLKTVPNELSRVNSQTLGRMSICPLLCPTLPQALGSCSGFPSSTKPQLTPFIPLRSHLFLPLLPRSSGLVRVPAPRAAILGRVWGFKP